MKKRGLVLFVCLMLAALPFPAVHADTPGGSNENAPAYNAEILRLVNIERASEGLDPLSGDYVQLDEVAKIRAAESGRKYSHRRPDGTTFYSAFEACKVQPKKFYGENLFAGYEDPKTVVQGWMDSPSHRSNILNPNYKYAGTAYVYDPNTYPYHFYSQEFSDQKLEASAK